MLSRVAENIYWLARYLERAENTARLLVATNHALLDAPRSPVSSSQTSDSGTESQSQSQYQALSGQGTDWSTLINISGSQELFYRTNPLPGEKSVMMFMACDRDNPNSIISSLSFARENLRTTRDAFPRKAMEYVNAMYLGFKTRTASGIDNEGKFYKTLDQVIQDSQKITGLLFSTMSRDRAFEFFRLGQILERADMTTRILDMGASEMQQVDDPSQLPFINTLWLNILRALSAEQMYRHHVHPRISWDRIIYFLLKDEQLPRAFCCCLKNASGSLSQLQNHDAPKAALKALLATLENTELDRVLQEKRLPVLLDTLQIGLGELCAEISKTYFITEPD
ncbi:MAG: alpha-E domain-containing protein [Magnetococcales bacterium]|nr:alpha-E domain-containing protein [Magnetococcales bacterium]